MQPVNREPAANLRKPASALSLALAPERDTVVGGRGRGLPLSARAEGNAFRFDAPVRLWHPGTSAPIHWMEGSSGVVTDENPSGSSQCCSTLCFHAGTTTVFSAPFRSVRTRSGLRVVSRLRSCRGIGAPEADAGWGAGKTSTLRRPRQAATRNRRRLRPPALAATRIHRPNTQVAIHATAWEAADACLSPDTPVTVACRGFGRACSICCLDLALSSRARAWPGLSRGWS